MAKNKQHQRKGKSTLKNLLASSQKAQAAADAQAKREKAKQTQALAVKKAASGGGGGAKGKKRREAGVVDEEGTTKSAKRVKRTRLVRPAERDDTVLLVGEGNFSFAHAMLLPPHNHPAHLLIATAYDTEAECYEKYPDAAEHVSAIRRLAGSEDAVLFNIDAGSLDTCKSLSSALSRRLAGPSSHLPTLDAPPPKKTRHHACFTKIIFNFPHVGQGHKDEARNVAANQLMLGRFLCSAAPLLSKGPTPDFNAKKKPGSKKLEGEADGDEEGEASDQDDLDLDSASDLDFNSHEAEAIEDQGDKTAETTKVKPWRLAPNRAGSILITLRNCKPYVLWDVPRLAKQLSTLLPRIAKAAPALPKGQSLPSAMLASSSPSSTSASSLAGMPRYQLWRSWEFDPSAFKGYEHRRTVGFVPGLSTEANEDILRGANRPKVTPGAAATTTGNAEDVRASRAGAGECRTWQFGLLPTTAE